MTDTDSLQQLLAPLPLEANLFPINSRYNGIKAVTMTTADGQSLVYLRRRFVPPPERFAVSILPP